MDTEEPALPPDPKLLNRQLKFYKQPSIIIIGTLVLAISWTAFFLLILIPQRKKADLTEAFGVRQIGFALQEFDSEYGSFPNTATAALLTKSHPGHGHDLTDTSSNAPFRQLFVAGLTESESMFRATIKDYKKPDGIITPGEALKKGECGFSYITGLSTKDDPLTPLVLTPLIPGTRKFDPKPFDGKAVILYIDNSVRSYDIHEDGHVYDKGIDLLSPKNPFWKGKAPDIRYPEL